MIYLPEDNSLRLKSFTSATRGTKGVIKIEVEANEVLIDWAAPRVGQAE